MHGSPTRSTPKVVTITPDMAMEMLQANNLNRPLSDQHVKRLSRQIMTGKWKFNGDTIKRSNRKDILDGQHRLWACIEAKTAIETIVVDNIDPEAFATIDTLRKPRSGSDVLSLLGVTNHRSTISNALTWLVRWQKKCLLEYRAPMNKVENSDIEGAWHDNPGIARAAERATKVRGLGGPGLIAFFYYILSNRNPDLAERLMMTLENPAGVGVNDPFFRLRAYLTARESSQNRDPIITIALMIKAANGAHANKEMRMVKWQNQGRMAEEFPKLDVGHADTRVR